jgi:hypothetical protein
MFKRIMVAVAFGLMAIAAQAEATFDEIQGLIQQQQYAAAASGLETIIQNHPKSAKAFYAMAQAQAGMGNLEKANKALTIATGLNPTLDFAPASSVASLKQAITPQTAKIEAVETSHIWRTLALLVLVAAGSYFIYTVYARKQDEEEAEREARYAQQREDARKAREAMEKADAQHKQAQREAELAQQLREQAERDEAVKAEEALKAHKNYGKPGFDPANPDKLKTKTQLKKEADEAAEKQRLFFEAEAKRERARAEAAEDEARRARMHYSTSPAPSTTVVNNSSNDMLTGVLIGNMISNSGHHHHDTERTVVRETVREVEAPAKSPRSSWDDIDSSSSSKSSSWDDSSSSSSRSSSWDSDRSSSSSSSWSSSSSSDSSSSWSSSDSSSSSSSWD